MKSGYNYFYWNCARGFLSKNKIEDIKVLVQNHDIHLIGISEVDLAIENLSFEEIKKEYHLENYNLILPTSWNSHGLARMIVYVKDNIKAKAISDVPSNDDLQHVLLEVGSGKSTHFVDFYYREWKSCVTGENKQSFHIDYLSRLTNVWRKYVEKEKDFLAIGDTNIDALKMNNPSYMHKCLAEIFKDFMYEENCFQMVDNVTRYRKVNDHEEKSCLDHVTVNCVNKIYKCSIYSIGDSDHQGLFINKRCKELRQSKRCIRKRIYKSFKNEDFIESISEAKR